VRKSPDPAKKTRRNMQMDPKRMKGGRGVTIFMVFTKVRGEGAT
jgi:hypothetical protein